MSPEERDLITGLFDRLRHFDSQPRDPEVERLIAGLVQRQPSAPYLLAQTVLVQEQALNAAQARIAELEAKAAAAPAVSSGFLAGAPKIGPWGAAPASPATRAAAAPAYSQAQPPAQPPAQPWGAAAPAAGGGFMRTALMTAAGVAGGALLFQGISSMMGGHAPNPSGGQQQGLAGDGLQSIPPPPDDRQALLDDGAADRQYAAADDSSFDSGGSDDSFA